MRSLLLLVAALLALAGCVGAEDDAPTGDTRLAFGVHEREDGTVVALGVLEWIDLEGGFYALTGAPGDGGTIAVVANPQDIITELEAFVGSPVELQGTLVEGASIRMAGPEIAVDSITQITEAPGPAE